MFYNRNNMTALIDQRIPGTEVAVRKMDRVIVTRIFTSLWCHRLVKIRFFNVSNPMAKRCLCWSRAAIGAASGLWGSGGKSMDLHHKIFYFQMQ